MKLKQSLLLIITSSLLMLSTNSHAGREGISFYYGLGLGVAAPTDYDAVAVSNVIFGFEEDGWAFEGIFLNTTKGESNVSGEDYSFSGSDVGIAYRTIENDKRWFKFKVSQIKGTLDRTQNIDVSEVAFTLGWGMRASLDSRMEFDYTYFSPDELEDPIHMLTFRYIWGGAKYQGRDL